MMTLVTTTGGDGVPPQPQVRVVVPEALIPGVYANALGAWSSPHEFTLDFISVQPTTMVADADGNQHPVTPAHVVARVKLAPTIVFNLLQAINAQMDQYEAQWGTIKVPGNEAPLYPPEDPAQ